MNNAMKTSFVNLEQAVQKLEGAVETAKVKSNGNQQDLFGSVKVKREGANNNTKINTQLLASRLDSAIEKVEKLLSEG